MDREEGSLLVAFKEKFQINEVNQEAHGEAISSHYDHQGPIT
jgi:hypothetical protein